MPVAEKTRQKIAIDSVVVRPAKPSDAVQIKEVYSRVFGENGIKAAEHQAYPAPDMFSEAGVKKAIKDPKRELLVLDADGTVAGGMVIYKLSDYHVEFACVAVDTRHRGLGLSHILLQHARDLAKSSVLTLNNTEIVTHSVHSQCAHSRAGFNKVTGFSFCQYPRVFFRNHEESCSWISQIDGSVAESLRKLRKNSTQSQKPDSTTESKLIEALIPKRHVFVPENISELTTDILAQFDDTLQYQVNATDYPELDLEQTSAFAKIELDKQEGEPFTYLYLPGELEEGWEEKLTQLLNEAKQLDGKHYIQARLSANRPATKAYAEFLERKGFIILGVLPIYHLTEDDTNGFSFGDVLLLQWISDDVLKRNELPGETNAAAKLYGHPLNINGALTKTMRRQLNHD